MFECYDQIIGLSTTTCECSEKDRPEDYNVSKSGIYLDELTSISRLIGLSDCDKNMWETLEASVASAITQFVTDTNALLAKRLRLKRKAATEQVLGQIKAKDVYASSKNYGMITVSCAPIRGGFMNLKKLGGIFKGTANVTVNVYDNVNGLIDSIILNTLPDKYVTSEANIRLPLYSKYLQPLEYYFIYAFDNENLPKDTELDCGCGGWTPNFNRSAPYYGNVGAHKAAPWSDYVMVGGREINSLTEIEDENASNGNNMLGLALEVDFGCKVDEVLCKESLDFVGNPLALSMALAVQYAAAIKVANAVIKSPILDVENMINIEQWEDDILVWQEKYSENVNYIVSEADYTTNDCFTCKDVLGLTRSGLFA